jgi:FdhE protein
VLVSEIGAPKQGLLNIGEEAKPPFAVLPDPESLFIIRSTRLAALAPGHQLEPYLNFASLVTRAQHDAQQALPALSLPSRDRIATALEHGMPPLTRSLPEPPDAVAAAVDGFLQRLAEARLPAETAAAIQALRNASPDQRRTMLLDALTSSDDGPDVAQWVLLLAGAQVHFARLAALLDAEALKPIADAVCPTCGSGPMTSSVVGWPKAHNTRFCTCSLCATMWNVVRVKCTLCSSTEGISYQTIEGEPDEIKAETCEKCGRYVKILYQVNDPSLDALADDVATLGLDMLLAKEGWKRGGENLFLLGY